MTRIFRFGVSALALAAATAGVGASLGMSGVALAQAAQPSPPPFTPSPSGPSPAPQIGPYQLRDFQLPGRERVPAPQGQPNATPAPAQPTPAATPPAQRPAPSATRPAPQQPRPQQAAPAPRPAAPQPTAAAPAAPAPADAAPEPAAVEPATAPPPSEPAPVASAPVAEPTPVQPTPPPAPAPATNDGALTEGPPLWVYFLALVTLALLGYGYWLRRQAVERRLALPAPGAGAGAGAATMRAATPTGTREPRTDHAPAEPREPRAAPIPRAWIDIDIVPERATASTDESVVEFELILRNTGPSAAKNLKLQARMFPSTPDQDGEITTFYRMRPGGEQRTLDAPDLAPGEELRIKGRVDLPGDRMRALKIEQRLLLIPLVALNIFYDWGSARSGQTSKSFIVGRERTEPGEKMSPFRLDLGARVYRTIGRRAYKLERRV